MENQLQGAMIRTSLLSLLLGSSALLVLPRADLSSSTPLPVQAAQATPVLVELFTSEGCSSCPPADELLRQLDARQDVPGAHVVVLSEHVDYWDHLGWRDVFASPAWTARQEQYSSILRNGEVYTPEAVVDGAHGVVGSDGAALRAQILAAARTEKKPLEITSAEWRGGDLVVSIAGGPYPGATLYAVLAEERARSQVSSGENAGRALEHVAVARQMVQIKQGSARLAGMGQRPSQVRVVVFAQARDGRIVAAAERQA